MLGHFVSRLLFWFENYFGDHQYLTTIQKGEGEQGQPESIFTFYKPAVSLNPNRNKFALEFSLELKDLVFDLPTLLYYPAKDEPKMNIGRLIFILTASCRPPCKSLFFNFHLAVVAYVEPGDSVILFCIHREIRTVRLLFLADNQSHCAS